MHNLQKWNIKIFRETHQLYLVLGTLCLGLPSSPVEIDVNIGLGISVSENEIYVALVLGIFVLENYTWPVSWNDPENRGGYTQ